MSIGASHPFKLFGKIGSIVNKTKSIHEIRCLSQNKMFKVINWTERYQMQSQRDTEKVVREKSIHLYHKLQ